VDRQDITLVSLWVHVPFVITWIGLIMIDLFAMFGPGLTDEQRTSIVTWSRPFVIVAIPVILITGIWQTSENPFYRVESYADLQELKKRLYGELLFYKHVFVIITFGLTILTRFVLAPRAGLLATTGGMVLESAEFRLLRLATGANGLAALAALMLATRMVIELH
jgi:hypothetical protein